MYIEKSKRLTVWNGGSIKEAHCTLLSKYFYFLYNKDCQGS